MLTIFFSSWHFPSEPTHWFDLMQTVAWKKSCFDMHNMEHTDHVCIRDGSVIACESRMDIICILYTHFTQPDTLFVMLSSESQWIGLPSSVYYSKCWCIPPPPGIMAQLYKLTAVSSGPLNVEYLRSCLSARERSNNFPLRLALLRVHPYPKTD